MNGLNNDIPSPVEEGVVDSIKNFFGRNKAITVDTSAIKSDINSALQQITSLAKTSEFKKLAKGLYKVSSGSMEVYDEHYKTIGDLNDKRFSEIPIKAGQELHVNIGEIQFWKIFPNKDRLDRSPGAERGDLSPEGKEFDRIVNEFSKALDEKVKSDKYKISIEWLVDWDDNNYDIVFKFVPRNYIKNDSGIKESFSSVSDKEAVQEELFPILTGKELPVREMSDGKAGALALATTIGIAGLGCGVLAVIGKGIEKLFGSHKSSGSGTVSRNDIEKIKRLSQQFMDTQQINSSERRKVFGEAYGLLKKHFDPMYFKTKAIEQGTEWNDPADFYSGKINIIEFAFTQSEHQSLVGDDKIDSSLPNDEYWKEYDKLAKKWIADVTKAANAINKELSKKYNGKYRIFFEELDGGYWDYFGEGDGDEGAVVIVDVDMIDRMKSYIKNHAVEESFTEVATEAEPVEEGIMSAIKTGLAGTAFVGAGLALWGIPIYFGYKALNKLGDKMEQDRMHKQHKAIEDKEKLIKKEAENSPFYDERSAAFKEALKIITKLFTAKFKDKNWLDLEPRADYFFLAGRTNMTFLGFVPSTLKSQGIPGEDEYIAKLKKSGKYDYDELDEDGTDYNLEPYYDEYNKFLDKLESDTNKKLSKMFGGKFSILISDNHNIEEFASDDYDYPGFVLLVDKTRLKNGEKFIDFNNIDNFLRESTEVATESTATNIAKVLGWFAVLVGAAAYKRRKDNKEAYEKAKKEQEAMVKERSKEIAEYAKQTDYVAKHPVNTKERKAVLNYAYKVIEKAVDKYYISLLDTKGNWTSFTGENKDPLIPDVFCIDVCSLTPPEHLDYEYEEEWEKDVAPLVSDANKELQKKFGKKYSLVREDYMIFLIDTTYKAGLLNAVKENYTPFMDAYTAALEGWGIAFTRFAVKHNLPFANKLEDKIWEWSESTVNQLTNIPEFKEYILREAPKAYDEAYLRNNNLSINVNADMISEFEEEYEDSEAYHKVDKKNCCFCKKIGKFYVGVFGDKSHIHGVWLLMSDSKNKKIYAKALPAPEKELNKFKYQK